MTNGNTLFLGGEEICEMGAVKWDYYVSETGLRLSK